MKNILFAALLILTGCATGSHILTGNAHQQISPDAVRFYSTPPTNYETVGIVTAHRIGDGQMVTDMITKELKRQAGLIGANGVIIGEFNSQTGQFISGISTTGTGLFGTSQPTTSISGTAIFVP